MGREEKRLLFSTASVIVILFLLTWVYASLFKSDVVELPVAARKDWLLNPKASLEGKRGNSKSIGEDSEASLIGKSGNKSTDEDSKASLGSKRKNKSIDEDSGASLSGKRENERISEVSFRFPLKRLLRGEERIQLETTGFSCHSGTNHEYCLTNKPVRIDTESSTIYIPSSKSQVRKTMIPYASKDAIQYVTPVQISNGENNYLPVCEFTHNIPAVVFSTRGYAGNLFHEISDTIIPLFLTCRHFRTHLKFIITDYQQWWVDKYSKILTGLSRYNVISADNAAVHCFPGAVIGLQFHGFLAINSTDIPGGYSMSDFRLFLRDAYSLKIKHISEFKREKPVLMLISRTNSRMFTNEDAMVVLMEELGFEVVVTAPKIMSNLEKFAGIVNSCSVMVGAHGAGLTNSVFLPSGAVLIQVAPLGLEWASTNYFGEPAKGMGLKYLEYTLEPEESSLLETYRRDDPVFTNPATVFSMGYHAARAVYVDGQNIKINLQKFRETLILARKLIGR